MTEIVLAKGWVVYIVKCADGTLYTGITNNINKRLETHNKGKGAKYTRSRLPVVLETFVDNMTKSEAAKLEYKVKQQKKENKILFLEGQEWIAKDEVPNPNNIKVGDIVTCRPENPHPGAGANGMVMGWDYKVEHIVDSGHLLLEGYIVLVEPQSVTLGNKNG